MGRLPAFLLGLLLVAHHTIMGWGYGNVGQHYMHGCIEAMRSVGIPEAWLGRLLYGLLPVLVGCVMMASALVRRRRTSV